MEGLKRLSDPYSSYAGRISDEIVIFAFPESLT
jgi:hypothetical protein